MKKAILILIAAMLMTSCGVGVYTHSSGQGDKSEISFVAAEKQVLDVSIDGQSYKVQSVKHKGWKKNRKIKKTVLNTIELATGKHNISASLNGNEIYSKFIFVSNGEHKVIEL